MFSFFRSLFSGNSGSPDNIPLAEDGDMVMTAAWYIESVIRFIVARVPYGEKYAAWWLNLLHASPRHLVIETTLILFIIFILYVSGLGSVIVKQSCTWSC